MKKKLALALAAVMMIGLFAGCGSKDNNSSNSNAGSSAGSAAGQHLSGDCHSRQRYAGRRVLL